MGKDSSYSGQWYNLWVGAKKTFNLTAIDVFSNYDQGQYAAFNTELGDY